MKCADDMTDDSPYRCGVEQLSLWCSQNNLELNMLRNVETSVRAVQLFQHRQNHQEDAAEDEQPELLQEVHSLHSEKHYCMVWI